MTFIGPIIQELRRQWIERKLLKIRLRLQDQTEAITLLSKAIGSMQKSIDGTRDELDRFVAIYHEALRRQS